MIRQIVSLTVWTFGAIPLTLTAYILYKRRNKRQREPLQNKDFKKDIVYLYQFPFLPKVRTISPFALKLETWLRMSGIEYESIQTFKSSKKGQIPYIELNGEEIPDSNVIIARLKNHFKDPDEIYNIKDQKIAHVVTSMIEQHTTITGFYYRYGLYMKKFMEYLQIFDFFPRTAITIWGIVMPWGMKLRCHLQGISRHELEEIWEFARKDLKAVSEILGDKPFLLGDYPSTVDCVLFGHLAQFLYIDIGFPQRDVLINECGNLVALVERIKSRYWQDWEEQMPQLP